MDSWFGSYSGPPWSPPRNIRAALAELFDGEEDEREEYFEPWSVADAKGALLSALLASKEGE